MAIFTIFEREILAIFPSGLALYEACRCLALAGLLLLVGKFLLDNFRCKEPRLLICVVLAVAEAILISLCVACL